MRVRAAAAPVDDLPGVPQPIPMDPPPIRRRREREIAVAADLTGGGAEAERPALGPAPSRVRS